MLDHPFDRTPDFERLRAVLLRQRTDGPVPLLELAADPEIMSEVTGIPFPAERARETVLGNVGTLDNFDPATAELGIALMDLSIAYSLKVGLGYATMLPVAQQRAAAHGALHRCGRHRREAQLRG